jgi:hypothetical protein
MRAFQGALFAAAMLVPGVALAQTFESGQAWADQHNSVLTIGKIDARGQFQGTFVSRANGFHCRGTPYRAVGLVHGDFITFQVDWKNGKTDCNAMSSWIGYVSGGHLNATWQLVYMDDKTKMPAVFGDTDVFAKRPAP